MVRTRHNHNPEAWFSFVLAPHGLGSIPVGLSPISATRTWSTSRTVQYSSLTPGFFSSIFFLSISFGYPSSTHKDLTIFGAPWILEVSPFLYYSYLLFDSKTCKGDLYTTGNNTLARAEKAIDLGEFLISLTRDTQRLVAQCHVLSAEQTCKKEMLGRAFVILLCDLVITGSRLSK
jgi:hypothetical protein